MRWIGDPPDKYRFHFAGSGLYLDPQAGVTAALSHEVEAVLGSEYPRLKPDLHWMTPVFHPNVSESGAVCLGGYTTDWVPGLAMDRLCEMLWDMLRWANFDPRSAYNIRAARWALTQRDFRFPLDPRQIRDKAARGERSMRADSRGAPPAKGIDFLD